MTESAPTHADSPSLSRDQVVWDDEIWVLAVHAPATGTSTSLILQAREAEALGQLDDEHASQLGRITNRLVRIIEHLPGAGTVTLGRLSGPHVNVTFAVDGVTQGQLHDIALKLANWGGEARA